MSPDIAMSDFELSCGDAAPDLLADCVVHMKVVHQITLPSRCRDRPPAAGAMESCHDIPNRRHRTGRRGIEIDDGPQRRRIWLGRGELDMLIERSPAAEVPRGDQPYRQREGVRPQFANRDMTNRNTRSATR